MKAEQVTIKVLPDTGANGSFDPYAVTPAEAELRAMKRRIFAEGIKFDYSVEGLRLLVDGDDVR